MKKKMLIFILMLVFMPNFIYADTIKIDCPSEVKPNSEFTCTVTGTTESAVKSVTATLALGNNFSFVSFKAGENWQGGGSNSAITLYSDKEFTKTFDIGTLKLKSGSSGSGDINLTSIIYGSADYKRISVANVSDTVTVKAPTTNNQQNNNGNNTGTGGNNTNAGNSGTGSGGNNVTTDKDNNTTDDEDVTTKNEEDTNTVENYVADITVSNYELNFDKDTHEYTLKIGEESKLDIFVILDDESVSYVINGNENLVNGSVIEVVINKNEEEVLTTYKINIEKDEVAVVEKKDNDMIKYIFIGIAGILVIVNIIRMLVSNRRGKNEEI